MKCGRQLELFAPTPAEARTLRRQLGRHDAATVVRQLREVERPRVHGFTPAQLRRLMRPLPRITVYD